MWRSGYYQRWKSGEKFQHREVIADIKLADIGQDETELVVWQDEIPTFFDGETMEALRLWMMFRKFGLPYGPAWALNPKPVMDILDVLEGEARRPRNEQ